MKVTRSYNFTFSKEDVEIILNMWEFMTELEDYEYSKLLEQAEAKDFFGDLDSLLHFAENHMEREKCRSIFQKINQTTIV